VNFGLLTGLGLVRDHTKEFSERRRRTVDRAYLEVTRLEKRLTKVFSAPPLPLLLLVQF